MLMLAGRTSNIRCSNCSLHPVRIAPLLKDLKDCRFLDGDLRGSKKLEAG